MKNLFSYLPKKALFAVATIAAVFGIGLAVQAGFGPDRPTYTMAVPADHITFNSITDNPIIGDERAFLRGALPGASNFTDPVTIANDGEEITLEIFVHNDAAANLNLKAQNTTVRVALPSGISRGTKTLTSYVSADNATPKEVFDTLDVTGADNKAFELKYVPGSAKLKTNKLDSVSIADSVVTSGALIGYDQLNGIVPGCSEFAGWVTLKVKVNMPNYAVDKMVRLKGEDSSKWRERANVKIGDTVQWLVRVTNIGSTNLDNIVVLDKLPLYMSVVPGSVKLIDDAHPASNPYVYPDSAIQQRDGRIWINVDTGDYAPNSGAYVMFDAVVNNDKAIQCDNTLLTNEAFATPQGFGTVNDIAQVVVETGKPCEQPKEPIFSCDSLNITATEDRKIEAKVSYTAKNGATFKDVTYNFGDGSSNLVTDKTSVNYAYAKDGTYTIKAIVGFMADNKYVTNTGAQCTNTVTFEKGQPIPTPTPTAPSELPNTGAGSVAGLFAGVTMLGAIGYRFWAIRKR